MATTTVIALAVLSPSANIKLGVPSAADPAVVNTLRINDPSGTDTQILLYAPGAGDGVASHRNANLVGLRATTNSQPFSYPVGLLGLRTTAISGYLVQYFFLDNATASNGTGIASYIPEIPGSSGYNAAVTTTVGVDPVIQGNMIRHSAASDYSWHNTTFGSPFSNFDAYVEARLVWRANNGITMTGVSLDGGANRGPTFGWNDQTPEWTLSTGQGGVNTPIATNNSVNPFDQVTVGSARVLRMEVMHDGAGNNEIVCYVDGIECIRATENTLNQDNGQVGVVFADENGIGSTFDNCVDIDWIRAGPITRTPAGLVATTGIGVLTPSQSVGFEIAITGLVATSAPGVCVPLIDVVLVGHVATGGLGAFGLGGVVAYATTGVLVPSIAIGIAGRSASVTGGVLVPQVEVTVALIGRLIYLTDGAFFETRVTIRPEAALAASGGLCAVQIVTGGSDTTSQVPNIPALFVQTLYTKLTQPPVTPPYTKYLQPDIGLTCSGTINTFRINSIEGLSFSPQAIDVGISGLNIRLTGSAVAATKGALGITLGADRSAQLTGFVVAAASGVLLRDPADPTVSFSVELVGQKATATLMRETHLMTHTYDKYGVVSGGPVPSIIVDSTTAASALRIDRTGGASDPNTCTPFGDSVVVFVPTEPTTICLMAPLGNNDIRLRPAWTVDPTDRMYVRDSYLTFIPSGFGDITYLVYHTHNGVGLCAFDVASRKVYSNTFAPSPQQFVLLRTQTINGVPSEGVNTPFTAATLNRPEAKVITLPDNRRVTQFVFGINIVNVTWTSELRAAPILTVKRYPDVSADHPPTEVLDLWISEQILTEWETLEARGSEVHHILFRYGGQTIYGTGVYLPLVGSLYYNDAASSSSEWKLVPTQTTADPTTTQIFLGGSQAALLPRTAADTGGPGVFLYDTRVYPFTDYAASYTWEAGDPGTPTSGANSYFAGYGAGKSWTFRAHYWNHGVFPTTIGDDTTVLVNYWSTQPTIYSVQIASRVGRVTTSITPNAALTGLRATTASGADSPFPLQTGDAHVWLVGRGVTAQQGVLEPPKITFLLDTFTDTDGVHLLSHVGESTTWLGTDHFDIVSNVLKPITNGSSGRSYASAVPPTRDYKVSWRADYSASGLHAGAVPELAVGVRCTDGVGGLSGYFFGYNPAEQRLYLCRAGISGVLNTIFSATVDFISHINTLTLEVNGINPTRVTCFLDGVVWGDYFDYGPQLPDIGVVTLLSRGYAALVGYFFDINGTYYEPGAFFLDGLRANTSQGVMTGPWPTGQRANTSTGVLTPEITSSGNVDQALTGLVVTAAQGVLLGSGDISQALTGKVATATLGIVTPWDGSATVGLLGLPILTYSGVLHYILDAYPTPDGLRLNTAQGAMVPTIDFALVGRSTTLAAGTLTPLLSFMLQGQGATTAQGVLSQLAENFSSLTGLGLSTAAGSLTTTASNTAAPLGRSATTGFGVLTPLVTVACTGSATVTSSGTLSVTLVIELTGVQTTATRGFFGVVLDKALTGQGATGVYGLLGYNYSGTVAVTGLQVNFGTGDVTSRFQKMKPDMMLWARTEVERLFSQEEPDECVKTNR